MVADYDLDRAVGAEILHVPFGREGQVAVVCLQQDRLIIISAE